MQAPPLFDLLQALLERQQVTQSGAELHGALCAQFCVVSGMSTSLWLQWAWPEAGQLDWELETALTALFDWTDAGMRDAELGFGLYLPEDDAPLEDRVDALKQWCDGFVSGLAMAGVDDFSALPDEAQEYVTDIVEIARAETADLAADEGDERAFYELAEYARIGALLVFESVRAALPADQSGEASSLS